MSDQIPHLEGYDAFSADPQGKTWGINFGGGVNSTALLLLCHDRGLRPDWVLFADTGSERPETYENVETVKTWAHAVGFPFETVKWIRKDGSFEAIHDNSLRTNYLPSKAYGLAGCTYKWKIQPMQRWRKQHGFIPTGVAIGYDAGEKRRIKAAHVRYCNSSDINILVELPWYPLVAWDVDRQACVERIKQQGWNTVKSSCFLCPSMRPAEWEELRVEHPSLFQVAVQVNTQAKAAGNAQTKDLFRSYDPNAASCMCSADGCAVEPEDVRVPHHEQEKGE